MALIDCPECGTQVSSAAPSCPKCGFPVADADSKATGKGRFNEAAHKADVDLLEPSEAESKRKLWKQKNKRDRRILAAIAAVVVVYLLLVLVGNKCSTVTTYDRSGRDAVEPVATVEPGSQSRGWVEGGNRPSSKVGAVPVSAEGSITNPAHTLGESRATILRLCERDDGTWIDGMCMLSRNMAVMFEWRNGRAMEHTIMKEDTSFGHSMVREFRKLGGKEDSTVAADGCDEYIWRNIGGRRYWVIICPSKGIATASARLLR
jgi:hypothetical protein